MKLTIFVHEFLPQVGHSRAMIELINGLTPDQKDQITFIKVVCLENGELNEIFSEFKCSKKVVRLPGKGLKPFILKMLLYHILSFFYSILFCKNEIKIGIGIASLNVDISNIQFIHEQWKEPFFTKRKLNFITFIYKKILFKYFEIGENILFKNKKINFIVIANFLKEYIEKRFGTSSSQITLIPSGVNTAEFSIPNEENSHIIQYLVSKYPQLSVIDFKKPVPLFIGAFERKGLDRVLDYLKDSSQQLILIGKPESFSKWNFPDSITIAHIPYTKEVSLFYAVSDIFIFPTYYEPFGLVILEAYAMGLDVIIPKDNVGASEILKVDDGLYFFNQIESLPSIKFKKITREIRYARRENRLNSLSSYTWKNASQKFYSILSKY